ncbi:TetR/AcrR family transcriptional regulator [uncultured Roseibium sp.]|uniref:TetR/AcrR family transcriptional regulator n=1 Tax=uncultured Roseibium sp. TaxID=1936171 RepID=UPI00262E532A|nr:TetR/AcrR family transcriptional regulator [uncultured Roseibium sp.]
MKAEATRQKIVERADELIYAKGFGETSFADIAGAVGISRGNFYYHFKSKDEILDAVIEKRLVDRERLLANWGETSDDPLKRIECFIKIVVVNQTKIMAYGCPVGTLTAELAKIDHGSGAKANEILALFRDWLTRQFLELGCGGEASAHALHVLSWSQGVATLAQAFKDEAFVRREVEQILDWAEAVKNQTGHAPKSATGR